MGFDLGLEFGGDDAGLGDNDEVSGVDFEDLVHAFEAEDESLMDGDGSATVAYTGSAWGDG